MTGYEPLNTPKPVADDIWVIDGPAIRFYGMPFSTRATLIRLEIFSVWLKGHPSSWARILTASQKEVGWMVLWELLPG